MGCLQQREMTGGRSVYRSRAATVNMTAVAMVTTQAAAVAAPATVTSSWSISTYSGMHGNEDKYTNRGKQ